MRILIGIINKFKRFLDRIINKEARRVIDFNNRYINRKQ